MGKKHQSKSTFSGFKQTSTTPVPDDLFDELLSILTGSELKVLLYIIRRTKGFNKDADAISLSQFQKGIVTKDGKQLDKGCGIRDRQTIVDAIASLESKKCIVCEKTKTASGDNAVSIYRVLFATEVVGKTNHPSEEKPTTLVGNSNQGGWENPEKVVGFSNPQKTVIQQTDLQQTELQESIANNDSENVDIVPNGTSLSLSTQDQMTEMKAKIEQLEALLQKSLGVTDTNMAGNNNSGVSANGSASSDGMEDIKTLEQKSRTDDAEILIADLTTKNDGLSETPKNTLVDIPLGPPAMPPESTKWCAETLVQIVEFRRNKRFLEDARGKNQKSQRERQLDAAKKIIDAKITREEFIKAYDARNDAWWQDNRGDLTVVDMAAKTTKGVMRTLEVLENIDSKKGVKTQSNGHQAQPSQCNSILTQEEKDFRKWLVSQPKEERPKILKARREARLAAQAQA